MHQEELVKGNLKDFSQCLIDDKAHKDAIRNAIIYQNFNGIKSGHVRQYVNFVHPYKEVPKTLQNLLDMLGRSDQEDKHVCFLQQLKELQG